MTLDVATTPAVPVRPAAHRPWLTGECRLHILHHIVKSPEASLDRTFSALVDPTRRAIIARLERQPGLSISELARPFPLKLPAILKHLDVLTRAGLLSRRKAGRVVSVDLLAGPIQEAMAWLKRYERL